MKIVVAGGTGFIGSNLVKRLAESGHSVVVMSRSNRPSEGNVIYARWDGATASDWTDAVSGADAIINLAGEPIAGKRWSRHQKDKILRSRIEPTRALVSAIELTGRKPDLLLNASAVGYYGSVEAGDVDESVPAGKGFLAETCISWENEASKAAEHGIRVVALRIGLVLSTAGGALPRLMLPFRLFAGGRLGSGSQWMPWIHIDDLVGMIMFILTDKELHGPVNAVSPEPVTMKEFVKVLGMVMRRPSWLPVPSFALRLMLGEMSEMLLNGQRAVPKKISSRGYRFGFSRLEEALNNLLKR